MPAMEKAAKDMLTLAQTVASGFAAVTPRASSDVVGFLADQELRAIVRCLKPEERQRLVAEARAGSHPDVVEAVLRANPMLSGLSPEAADSLSRAGIAASRAEDIEGLKQMLAIYDDVLATASNAGVALSGMVANSNGYTGRFEKWRSGCEGSEALRDWLSKLPAKHQPKSGAAESKQSDTE